jgi:hypothetical protein
MMFKAERTASKSVRAPTVSRSERRPINTEFPGDFGLQATSVSLLVGPIPRLPLNVISGTTSGLGFH